MPRMQKRPIVESIRRKCFTCGSIKEVQHKHFTMPRNTTQTTYTTNMDKKVLRTDVKGVEIKYYCSTDCAGPEFINSYDEDQFIRP